MIKSLLGLVQKSRPSRYSHPVEDAQLPAVQNSSYHTSELYDWIFGNISASGLPVNERTVMCVSAVYASVALIGGAIATLPKAIYERTSDGRQKVSHDVWWLLNEQPNSKQSAAVFWECLIGSLLLHGDGFAEIQRPSRYSPSIIGFKWHKKKDVVVDEIDGRLNYAISENGQFKYSLDQSDMIHIPGPGFDGKTGLSQIRWVLRNPAGIALAADEYSANFFQNGARPDFVIQHPTSPTPEQITQLRESWEQRYQGVKKSHKPAILTGGATVQELTMNAEDAQLITTRQFQVEDIARIFGVPPHLIGHTQNNTSWGTGIEQMSIGFVKYTLSRHLVKIEQELNRKIWPNRQKYFVECVTAGLERGDYKTRNEGYRIALGRAGEPAWMTTNEVRRLENLPPIDGGDQLFTGITNAPTEQTAIA